MAAPEKLVISGKVIIKYIDETTPQTGDIMLYMHDDATNPYFGDYDTLNKNGYIKADIYDGKFWQALDIGEFCTERENKYAKRQRPIDTAYLCREIIISYKDSLIYRTYRGHYTRHLYEQNEYIRKASHGRKRK